MSPDTFARLRRLSAVQVLAGATGTPRRYQGVLAEYAARLLASECGAPVTGATVAPPEAALSCDGAEAWLASLTSTPDHSTGTIKQTSPPCTGATVTPVLFNTPGENMHPYPDLIKRIISDTATRLFESMPPATLAAQVAEHVSVDLSDLAAEIPLSDLAAEFDLSDLAAEFDTGDIAREIDLTDLAGNIDVSDLDLDSLDLTVLATHLDLSALAGEIDMRDLARRLDVKDLDLSALAGEIDLSALAREVGTLDVFSADDLQKIAAGIDLSELAREVRKAAGAATVPPAPVPVQAAEVPDLSARLLSDAVDRLLALADAAVRDGKI